MGRKGPWQRAGALGLSLLVVQAAGAPYGGLAFAAEASPRLVVVTLSAGEGATDKAAARFTQLLSEELRNRSDQVSLVAGGAAIAGEARAAAPARPRGPSSASVQALTEGKKALADLRFDAAAAGLKRGIDQQLSDPATADYPAVYEGLISLAVAQFRMGDDRAAQGSLFTINRLDPTHKLPEGKFPPVFVREFEKAKKRAEKQVKAGISIDAPMGATAFINGRDLGMVPIVDEKLPSGTHYVRVEGAKGEWFGQVVELKASSVKVKASFSGAAERTASAPATEPRVGTSVDPETLARLAQYCRAVNADYAVIGAVYRTGEYQLTAGTALYSAKKNAVAALPPMPFDQELMTASVEAYKLADHVVTRLGAFSAAPLPLALLARPAQVAAKSRPESKIIDVDVGPTPVSRRPADPRLTPKTGEPKTGEPKTRARPLASASRSDTGVALVPTEPEPEPPPEKSGTSVWLWVGLGIGAAAIAGGAYYGISQAQRPVTGTVTARW